MALSHLYPASQLRSRLFLTLLAVLYCRSTIRIDYCHAQAPQAFDASEDFPKLIAKPVAAVSTDAAALPATNAIPADPISLAAAEVPIAAEVTAEQIEVKREIVGEQLRVAMLQERVKDATTEAPATPAADKSQVDVLKQIDATVAQQKTITSTLNDLETKRVELSNALAKLATGQLDQQPPYSILMLDELRETLKNYKAKSETSTDALISSRHSTERTATLVQTRQRESRQQSESTAGSTVTQSNIADLEIKLAQEQLLLRKQELAVDESNAANLKLQITLAEKKIAIIGDEVVFTPEMLNTKIAELDARESTLTRQASLLQSEEQYAERRWMTSRQEFESAATPEAALIQRVDALKIAQQTVQVETSIVNQRLQRLPLLRTAWERRFRVATDTASREEKGEWLRTNKEHRDQLQRDRRTKDLKLNEVRISLADVDGKQESNGQLDAESQRWLKRKHDALRKQVEAYSGSLMAIDFAEQTLEKLDQQITGSRHTSVSDIMGDAWFAAKRCWNYEIAQIDGNFLTVGKILSVLMFVLIGYCAARWFSRLLGRRLPKFGIDEAGAHAIEALSMYAMLIAFGLGALRYAHVPLTVFTFLGGAIAIGVGFGSQNIVNNFISGLILLAERPIKVGDLIRIDQTHGTVTHIGARSTLIRTGENMDIVVPNSKFLENNVVNLTRRDDRLRTSIKVGVAYGSNLELVMELLEQSATEHPSIDQRHKPFVWFNDFGDNALAFELHFWLNTRTLTQMRKIETDIRLNIDRLFRQNDVCIAFPQRDLHLQTLRPLEMRLVNADQLALAGKRAA